MPSMVRFFGELAATGAAHQGGRRSSIRRGSEIGERLEHTIHLTSQSSTPSAHDVGEGFNPLQWVVKYMHLKARLSFKSVSLEGDCPGLLGWGVSHFKLLLVTLNKITVKVLHLNTWTCDKVPQVVAFLNCYKIRRHFLFLFHRYRYQYHHHHLGFFKIIIMRMVRTVCLHFTLVNHHYHLHHDSSFSSSTPIVNILVINVMIIVIINAVIL